MSHRAGPRVAIVGGGLAGIAAAAALAEDCQVELFEARRMLGGRATSFQDPASGQWIDHCQHVSMGCCTNLADLCRRAGVVGEFRRDRMLHFIGTGGQQFDVAASRVLPAPLHLAPSLARLGYLCWRDKLGIARALWKLARLKGGDDSRLPAIGQWLRDQGQSAAAIERFWSVVLVSALGESLERASLLAARKVFLDGFLGARTAYEIEVPTISLAELYGERLHTWLMSCGVSLRLSTPVKQIDHTSSAGLSIDTAESSRQPFNYVVLALAWRQVTTALSPALQHELAWVAGLSQIESAPITGVHLWFDRPITPLPHAVLAGRLSQWMFNRGQQGSAEGAPQEHYYQVVISASHDIAGRDRAEIIETVRTELAAVWPAAREAVLIRARLVTEPNSVFSVRPGFESLRPPQQTAVPGLLVAGDWTLTGWPATMEGAVRSGYLAAEAVLRSIGKPRAVMQPELRWGMLSRMLFPPT